MVVKDLELSAIQRRQVANTCAWITSFLLGHHFSGRLKLLLSHYQLYFSSFTFPTSKIKASPLTKIIARTTSKLLKRIVSKNCANSWLLNCLIKFYLVDASYENAWKDNTKKFWNVYMLYASVRLLVGLGMLAAYFHIYIFTLEMPDRYICDRAPCTGLTTCYVGKFTIKQLVLLSFKQLVATVSVKII